MNKSDSALRKAGSEMTLPFIKRSPETLPVIMPTIGSAIFLDELRNPHPTGVVKGTG
jgi:hypothetical protein